jgi:DNA-binding transcriptional regulator YiaG
MELAFFPDSSANEMAASRSHWVQMAAAQSRPTAFVIGTGGIMPVPQATGTSTAKLALELTEKADSEFAGYIEQLRVGLRLSYAEIASAFGVSRQSVYNWQKGENVHDAHQQKMHRLIEGYAEVAELLGGRKERFSLRVLRGTKTFLQLLSEDDQEAFVLLAASLKQSDVRVAVLRQHQSKRTPESILPHFDPLS